LAADQRPHHDHERAELRERIGLRRDDRARHRPNLSTGLQVNYSYTAKGYLEKLALATSAYREPVAGHARRTAGDIDHAGFRQGPLASKM